MVEVIRPDLARLTGDAIHPGLYVYERIGPSSAFPIDTIAKTAKDNFRTLHSGQEFSSINLGEIALPGDILRVDRKSNNARIVLSHGNTHNTLLTTDECNNRCLFCSQPPKKSGSYFYDSQAALANFTSGGVIGLSGGEPTLFWEELLSLLCNQESWSEGREFHLLSHGRFFASTKIVEELARADFDLDKILFGIPVHGHYAALHNRIANVAGAYAETIDGLVNLAFAGANLEVRIVVNSHNFQYLPEIVSRITATLRYARFFIAIMQLEPAGWAKNRYSELFVSADKQSRYIEEAISIATLSGTAVRLYNYPLCQLHESVTSFAEKSISDWKNHFPKECNNCSLKQDCAGFFKSAVSIGKANVSPVQ